MLEMLFNPKRAERHPWEMFFVGLLYAGLSMVLANVLFADNPVFSKHISILLITFTVMFSLPFFYFIIKLEERSSHDSSKENLWTRHERAISALMWLFLGFVVAFSLGYILFPSAIANTFQAQIEQYCSINMPSQFNDCVSRYGGAFAGAATSKDYAMNIFVNNVYVLIFSLIFSLIFGAGAIFILAWNASVIATAIGIFSRASLPNLPISLARYLIHGIPEIAAYFVAALAGGIMSVALIKHDANDDNFWNIMKDAVDLILVSIVLLVIGVAIEVLVTPRLF